MSEINKDDLSITPENLKAAGFEPLGDNALGWCYEWQFSQPTLTFDNGKVALWNSEFDKSYVTIRFYPETMADIEALKRMLTPK